MYHNLITERNIFLVLAMIFGIVLPDYANIIKPHTLLVLGLVMTLSLTAISTASFKPLKTIVRPFLKGIVLNQLLLGLFLGLAALFYINDKDILMGMMILIATPPGVAIIPFSAKLKGDIDVAVKGTFGAFFASIFIAPILLGFMSAAGVNPFEVLKLMIYLVVVPFIISRFLLHKTVIPHVVKLRGLIIDVGFTIIIYVSIGLNSHVFYTDFTLIATLFTLFIIIMFGVSKLYTVLLKNKFSEPELLSQKLLFSIKSTGFATVTAINLFSVRAAIPSTVMSIAVLVLLLYLAITGVKKKVVINK